MLSSIKHCAEMAGYFRRAGGVNPLVTLLSLWLWSIYTWNSPRSSLTRLAYFLFDFGLSERDDT